MSKIIEPETYVFEANGAIPNSKLSVLVYRNAVPVDPDKAEDVFRSNEWVVDWRIYDGFFPFHHFHSNTHEAVAVARGSLSGTIGGPGGTPVSLSAGDVAVLPAGVGHCHLSKSDDVILIGAYPKGYEIWNLHRADPKEYDLVQQAISRVPMPETDPLHGKGGPLQSVWKKDMAS